MTTGSLALDGLRVLDLTSQLSGPYCAMLLGDLGADVIKLERPGVGDDARAVSPKIRGESAAFMTYNRNKRSITLDLKAPAGRTVGLALAARADVVLENFRPGATARLGLGYDHVRAINPRVIYCSISGFGQTGPYRERGGFDRIAQGMSGFMSISGEADGPPLPLPIPIADIGTGMFATIGILAALAARSRTGRGQHVDTSLGEVPERLGPGHRASAPYQAFRTKDSWINLGGGSPGFWPKICALLGVPELVDDPRFRTPGDRVRHRRELEALLQPRFEKETTATWLDRLEAEGVPAGPILTYDQVFADPQVVHREMAVPVDHPVAGRTRVLGIPIKLSDTPARIRRPAPTLGQHTDEVLSELGYDAAAIGRLRAERVI